MTEGGYDFDFDADDIYDDDGTDDIDERLPMVPTEVDQRIISNQNDSIADLRGQLRQNALDGQKQNLVKIFYDEIGKRYKMAPEKIDYNQFRISDDGKTLYWVVGDKEIRITAKQGSATFLSLSSLVKEYNRAVGSGGTQAIRQYLNLPEYNSRTKPLSKQARQALESTRNDLVNVEEHILLKDLSSTTELQSLTNTIGELHETVESLETSMTDWGLELLIVLGFNDTSTLEGHFVSSPREREKRDRRESRGDEREGQGRKRNRNESEETEEIKTFPLYPYPLQG